MNEYKDFSSFPPEQERSFVPFERASIENGKKAWIISLIACAAFLMTVLVVVFSFEPPEPKMSDEDLGSLERAASPAAKAKAPAAETEAPAAEAAAEAAEAEAPAAEAEGDEAKGEE